MQAPAFPALLAAIVLALPVAAQAAAEPAEPAATNVVVSFTAPEKFLDATYQNREDTRAAVTRDLAAYLADLGKRYLPAGQHLDIEVIDVDLAGQYEPWRPYNTDVRYMREVTWPRITVKYRLSADGADIAQGEDVVQNQMYLRRPNVRSGDPLRYEKAMLEDWFRRNFDPAVTKAARAS